MGGAYGVEHFVMGGEAGQQRRWGGYFEALQQKLRRHSIALLPQGFEPSAGFGPVPPGFSEALREVFPHMLCQEGRAQFVRRCKKCFAVDSPAYFLGLKRLGTQHFGLNGHMVFGSRFRG